MKPRHSPRDGIVLLIVLVLLVLFLLIGITFVLTTGQWYESTSEASQSHEIEDPSRDVLYQSLYDFIGGSSNPYSPFYTHNLGGDLYGNVSFRGVVAAPSSPLSATGGQFIELQISPEAGYKLSNIDDYYNGRVITMLSGASEGQSRRIVDYIASSGTFHIETLEPDVSSSDFPVMGDKILINGREFSGLGLGLEFDSVNDTWDLKAVDGSARPRYLLPNTQYFVPTAAYPSPLGPGDVNEPWDAPGLSDPYLYASPPDPQDSHEIKPSFHLPGLINYWADTLASDDLDVLRTTNADVYRQISWRPNGGAAGTDHEFFTGSNPNFNPISGPWDVDNDGDFIFDSIWMDPGYPAIRWKDGRRVKPLIAMMVKDLDGKINLNAALDKHQPNAAYYGAYSFAVSPSDDDDTDKMLSMATPRGHGFGPAEVNVALALDANRTPPIDAAVVSQLGALMNGLNEYYGLYGDAIGGGEPGVLNSKDPLNALSELYEFGSSPGSYSTPWDQLGRGTMVLDPRGQPLYADMSEPTLDNAYELNLNHLMPGVRSDLPFTPAELEALLRPFDVDYGTMPKRLVGLAPLITANKDIFTTESWDIPVPGLVPPRELRQYLPNGRAHHISDLLRARFKRANGGWTNAQLDIAVNEFIATLTNGGKDAISPEMLAGLPFNVNRPFGNGGDDNSNGIVDEPGEAATELAFPTNFGGGAFPNSYFSSPPIFDHNSSGARDGQDDYARMLYARQLYMLAMLLRDDQFEHYTTSGSTDASLPAASKRLLYTIRLAQWAVNVADFRDADRIMTAFEFDVNPWNGWDVDGDPFTDDFDHADRFVVWGMEYPALQLTEAFAMHNRRVSDASTDSSGSGHAFSDGDTTMDQKGLPEGPAFFELYCTAHPSLTFDFGALSPSDVNGKTHSVWRLAITSSSDDVESLFGASGRPQTAALRPDDTSGLTIHTNLLNASDTLTIERVIWLAQPASASEIPTDVQNILYYRRDGSGSLSGGQHLVIGGSRWFESSAYTTYIGKGTDNTLPSAQRITLDGTNGVLAYDGSGTRNYAPAGDYKTPGYMICGADISLAGWTGGATAPSFLGASVSERLPTSYYPEPAVNDTTGKNFDYTTPLDASLDEAAGPLLDDNLLATGTTANYKTALLQRLADPTRAFDAATNPYITVDWLPIDLTVFNGEELPNAMDTYNQPSPTVYFNTRERGDFSNVDNFWNASSTAATSAATATTLSANSNRFDYDLDHTLGYSNDTYGARYTASSAPTSDYIGDPIAPMPWLGWADRPFMSQYELLNVPASAPSRFSTEFPAKFSTITYDHYGSTDSRGPYPHLLNVFNSSATAGGGSQIGRIFEFLHVPSRFEGTKKFLNPSEFAGYTSPGDGRSRFCPPFNWLSQYREPGRINLNTTFSVKIYDALRNTHPGPGYGLFMASRRGDAVFGTTTMFDYPTIILASDPPPSLFPNPFRPETAADLGPVPSPIPADVNAGFLRPDPTATALPLFREQELSNDYRNTNRNPYFRHLGLTRMGNTTTQRSNTYAIWITVGYFEVESVDSSLVYPDGYKFGAEVGIDTGDITRRRAFFIVDRSIPFGYEAGKRHNLQNVIRHAKMIE